MLNAGQGAEQDESLLSSCEVEYQLQLLIKTMARPEFCEPDLVGSAWQDLWWKAFATEKRLREGLAWYKRLPPDVTKKITLRNLAKVLSRLAKLFNAHSSAVRILSAFLKLKQTLSRVHAAADVFRQAKQLRSMLKTFRSENSFFGGEFMFEDIDLYRAFEKIHFVIKRKKEDPRECMRLIGNAVMLQSEAMRESCETMLLREFPVDSLTEDEKSELEFSVFDDEELRRIRIKSHLDKHRSKKGSDSCQDTERLSTEQCGPILCKLDVQKATGGASSTVNLTSHDEHRVKTLNRVWSAGEQVCFVASNSDEDSCSTELDHVFVSPFAKGFVITTPVQLKEELRAKLKMPNLELVAAESRKLDSDFEDEDLQTATLRLTEDSARVVVAVEDYAQDF